MSEPDEKALVAQILSSYLSNNTVAPADLPSVIESVKKAFEDLATRRSRKEVGHTRRGYMPMLRAEAQNSEAALANDPSTQPARVSCCFRVKERLSAGRAELCRTSI
jgi:hypothetical protein